MGDEEESDEQVDSFEVVFVVEGGWGQSEGLVDVFGSTEHEKTADDFLAKPN